MTLATDLDRTRLRALREAKQAQVPGEYISPNFVNNWTHALSGYSKVGYLITPDGWVSLRGRALRASGTPSTTEIMFTLPPGFRPSGQLEFVVPTTGSAIAFGQVDIQADGDVLWVAGSTSAGASYVSLNLPLFRPV